MTENEWLASDDPAAMLAQFVPSSGRSSGTGNRLNSFPISDRKLRLWCCGCCLMRGTPAYTVDEYEKDGPPDREDEDAHDDRTWAKGWTEKGTGKPSIAERAALLRCVVGNPYRPVTLPKCKRCEGDGKAQGADRPFEWTPEVGYPGPCPVCKGLKSDSPWLTRHEGAVPKMARSIYEDRSFEDMSILADLLEMAGCEDTVPCPRCDGGRKNAGVRKENFNGPLLWPKDLCCVCHGTGRVPNPLLQHCRSGGPHCRGCWVLDLLLGMG
jgi:hypothetical protein